MEDRVNYAFESGYDVDLVFVDTPVEVCLYRNRLRGLNITQKEIQEGLERERRARRKVYNDGYGAHEVRFDEGQFVPENVILDKAQVMHTSFSQILTQVRKVVHHTWNLSEEAQTELARAKLDLFCYPAPRAESVPATDPLYGVPPDGACSPSKRPGSKRTLRMAHWKRDNAVAKKKKKRLNWMDDELQSRESLIERTVFKNGDPWVMERNMFPYQMPKSCEHWTLWARNELSHDGICDIVEGWLDTCRRRREANTETPEMPSGEVGSWNYDDNNSRRTIDIPHLHIYLCLEPTNSTNDGRISKEAILSDGPGGGKAGKTPAV